MVVVCCCSDLMRVTGCPTLAPVNTSSEKRNVVARGREVIKDYEGFHSDFNNCNSC